MLILLTVTETTDYCIENVRTKMCPKFFVRTFNTYFINRTLPDGDGHLIVDTKLSIMVAEGFAGLFGSLLLTLSGLDESAATRSIFGLCAAVELLHCDDNETVATDPLASIARLKLFLSILTVTEEFFSSLPIP